MSVYRGLTQSSSSSVSPGVSEHHESSLETERGIHKQTIPQTKLMVQPALKLKSVIAQKTNKYFSESNIGQVQKNCDKFE